MSDPILIARTAATPRADVFLLPAMANRHGLIAGATGTGKTVTLQALAQAFSARGVPVFLADVKGDLAGMSQPGGGSEKVKQRIAELEIGDFSPVAAPVTFWDVFGASGHPIRTTISEMGPLLLARLLNLNDTQTGVLTLVFKIADDQGLLLLDLKDLRAVVQHVGEHAAEFTTEYGNVSAASIGAIQRNLLGLEQQGADRFFGEPALNPDDFLQTDAQGRGVVNVLAADKLMQAPKVYATLLLWLLSELFERMPEAGDLAQPKLVFFFDEAHLLFKDLPAALEEKIEQVVRLIRSKGVGVYFVTQSPRDVPGEVLAQLGNRVQHNLRAFTPEDLKAVKQAAQTFRANPTFDTAEAMTQLAVGEALISTLDENGQPNVVQRAFVIPPASQLGAITAAQRTQIIQASPVFGVYEKTVDRESAYEKLKGAALNGSAAAPVGTAPAAVPADRSMMNETLQKALGLGSAVWNAGRTSPRSQSIAESLAKSVVRSVGTQIARGIMGSIFGGTRRR